jgi:multidrug efflux pump subunit AcrA (membrane-fusion protein)
MVKADAIDKAEVEAQIPIARMRTLLHSEAPIDLNRLDPSQLAYRLGIQAQVWLRDSGGDVRWEARFARMSDTLDPDTRTIGVIVEVDQPYAGVQPGKRPPLVKGLFVEVELRGPPRPERLVVPRHALHKDRVYLLEGHRLSLRPVEVDSLLPDYAVIGAGLAPGDRVVVSDLVPAIEGMRLQGQADEDALDRLVRAAEARD